MTAEYFFITIPYHNYYSQTINKRYIMNEFFFAFAGILLILMFADTIWTIMGEGFVLAEGREWKHTDK